MPDFVLRCRKTEKGNHGIVGCDELSVIRGMPDLPRLLQQFLFANLEAHLQVFYECAARVVFSGEHCRLLSDHLGNLFAREGSTGQRGMVLGDVTQIIVIRRKARA